MAGGSAVARIATTKTGCLFGVKNPREISQLKFPDCGTYYGKLPFTGLFCGAFSSASTAVGRVDPAFCLVFSTNRRSSLTYFWNVTAGAR